MSNEELVELYQLGSKAALERIVENNKGLVHKLAGHYIKVCSKVEFDDLLQSGYVGLIKAVKKYKSNIERPTKFSTYAFMLVKQEILEFINGHSTREKFNIENDKLCTSLYAPLKNDEEAELIDTIDSHDNSIVNVEDKLYLEELRSELEGAMKENDTLTEREILKLIYGWDMDPISIEEVAALLSMEHSKVRSLQARALRNIRNSTWCRIKGKEYMNEL